MVFCILYQSNVRKELAEVAFKIYNKTNQKI